MGDYNWYEWDDMLPRWWGRKRKQKTRKERAEEKRLKKLKDRREANRARSKTSMFQMLRDIKSERRASHVANAGAVLFSELLEEQVGQAPTFDPLSAIWDEPESGAV